MKTKRISIFLCVVMIATAFAVGVPVNVSAEPGIIHVDDDAPNDPGPNDPTVSDPFEDGTPEHPFDTIKEGIDNAISSDTVYVHEGTYPENVKIYKDDITLEGENKETTIIQGSGSGNGIYSYGVSGITIKTLKIQGFPVGICFYSSGDSIIIGNTISVPYGWVCRAIYLSYSPSVTMSNNVMSRGGIFIEGAQSSDWDTHTIDDTNTVGGKPVQFCKNTVGGTIPAGAGQVILASCSNMIVENQDISDVYTGIAVTYGSGNIIRWNAASGDCYGIILYSSSGSTLTDNTASGYMAGIVLSFSSGSTLTGNMASGGNVGISLGTSGGSTLVGNTVTMLDSSSWGILLGSSGDSTLIENIVTGCYYGIGLLYSSGITLARNMVSGNTYGIYLTSNYGENTLIGNTVSSNTYGIYLTSNYGENTLIGNTVSSNTYGIYLTSNYGENTLIGNTVSSNTIGIFLYFSFGGDNILFHNNIIDNTIQVFSWFSANTWDNGYPSGGNYWSDYTGIDEMSGPNQDIEGSDEIGDTPYVIDPNNQDNYPLMDPWGPEDEIELIIEDIEEMGLSKGIEESLVSILEAAINAIENDNENAAIQQLEAFILLVEAYRGKKLTDEQADALIEAAQWIIEILS